MILNGKNTTNPVTKAFFEANNYTWFHHFYGDINAPVWSNYGYDYYYGFKAVIDRDGNLRWTGHSYTQAKTTMFQCLGVAE